jgi:hypothetical protein
VIVTELYDGQGFGNQLWSYVFTRVLALDKELEFGIQSPQRFKGKDFMHLDMGRPVLGGLGPEGGPPLSLPKGIKYYYSERVIRHPENDIDIRMVDPGFQDLVDNTKIDGIFQAEEYISHRKDEIRDWLGYEQTRLDIDFDDPNICVINFRGGEYARNARIFLRRKYWFDAIAEVRKLNPNVRFVVITDDPSRAQKFFPRFEIRHYGIHGDYQAINSAQYLILSNSSFAFFPAWLNQNLRFCIAPKYWSAHNESDGYWGCSYNIVRDWIYLDRKGKKWNYNQCSMQFNEYRLQKHAYFDQKHIEQALLVVSSFNNDLSWLPRYSKNYFVFEQGAGSGLPPQLDESKVRFVPHSGSCFQDYFTFIIENYDNLPDILYLIKGNVFPRHLRQHVFDTYVTKIPPQALVDRRIHTTHFPEAFFAPDGHYFEFNSDWFFHAPVPRKYFQSVNALLKFLDPDAREYLYNKFSLAGQVITTREVIQRLPREAYEILSRIVTHDGTAVGYTLECFLVERTLDRVWLGKASRIQTPVMPPELVWAEEHRAKSSFRSLIAILVSLLGRMSYYVVGTSCHVFTAARNRARLSRNRASGFRLYVQENVYVRRQSKRTSLSSSVQTVPSSRARS